MTEITNEKYVLLKESLKALSLGNINIVTLVGSPGMGKTYTTLEYLKENNLNYEYINSYATPLSFYKILYENRNKEVIIFDDLHGVNNQLILSMLKSACWISNGNRTVSYYSTSSKIDDEELPSSFEFNSKVVLIFNKKIKDYEAITSRGLTIEFKFDFKEKMKIFEEVKTDAEIDEDVWEYVKGACSDQTSNLSIRTLVQLSKIKKGGQDFKIFAKGMLTIDEDRELLFSMTAKEWSDATGKHTRTYYKKKEKLE